MGKIIDKHGNIVKQDDQMCLYTVLDLLEENDFYSCKYDYLSELIQTMTGDASTPFDTIGELVACIPEIVSCGEECEFLYIMDDDELVNWHILGWSNEDNTEVCNKVLKAYFSEYEVVAD